MILLEKRSVDNLNHTTTAATTDGKEEAFPLSDFFSDLKKNGFTVTTLQVMQAHQILMQYASWVKHEGELCMYLTPVFAGSEDEQQLFKKLFDKHFNSPLPHQTTVQKPPPGAEDKLKKHWKKYLALYAFIALMVILVIIRTSLHTTHLDPQAIEISLVNKNELNLEGTAQENFRVKTNEAWSCLLFASINKPEANWKPLWFTTGEIRVPPAHCHRIFILLPANIK